MAGRTPGPVIGAKRPSSVDETADRLVAFLRAKGGAEHPHARGRTLLDHLVGTYEILRRWDQPVWLQHAALIHSVYGTEAHPHWLVPVSTRAALVELAGDRAERLAYLFCATPRKPLFAGAHMWLRNFPQLPLGGDRDARGEPPADRGELDALLVLHMANLAEQARAADASPGTWLVRLRDLADLLIDSATVSLPSFVGGLASLSEADEALARRSYRSAVAASDDPEQRASGLALAAAVCPVVAEPCIWQAHHARCRGHTGVARQWTRRARRRLVALGTAWDKRLSYDEWLDLTRALEQPSDRRPPPAERALADPRALFEAVVERRPARAAARPAEPAAGTARFQRYMEALADGDGAAVRGVYPDLESRPWYEPAEFPLVQYLESHFVEIRAEILALHGSRFHPESERIPRSGDWDVAFLYERGRRRDDVYEGCPVTTRGVEGHGTMRTAAGLIYVSRMRAGTHIAAHRGPTNLRLRCHLGIAVPRGDCAIRVSDETRRWTEGRCLVFDDYFEHEAWNHTSEDRIVLIVDLWHPGLSEAEIRLLEGLQWYAYSYARRLNRYWASNAAARRTDG
jgi:aspartate beta-hydroxylase